MVKKVTTIFFLTLASLIMLAFTVVPHHHHQEYLCFNSIHCNDQESEESHAHDEDPIETNHGCVRNLFQTPISRLQTLEHSCSDGHCHHFIFISFLVPDLLALLSLEAEGQAKPNLNYQERLHSICYTSNLSGRAPPYKG